MMCVMVGMHVVTLSPWPVVDRNGRKSDTGQPGDQASLDVVTKVIVNDYLIGGT